MPNFEKKGKIAFREIYHQLKRNPKACKESPDISYCAKQQAEQLCKSLPITNIQKRDFKRGIKEEFTYQHLFEPKSLIVKEKGQKLQMYE